MSVASIAEVVQPWNDFYSKYKLVSGTVTFLHIGALLVAGGLAIASDRAVLRTGGATDGIRRHVLDEIAAVHGPVITALTIVFMSGIAMALADVETFLVSAVFWTKMAVIVALLVNGWFLRGAEGRLRGGAADDQKAWRRLRLGATLSVTLWLTTTLLGVAVMSS